MADETTKKAVIQIEADVKKADSQVDKFKKNTEQQGVTVPVNIDLDSITKALHSIQGAVNKMEKSFDKDVKFSGLQKGLDDVLSKIESVTKTFNKGKPEEFQAFKVSLVGMDKLYDVTKTIKENIESLNDSKIDLSSFERLEETFKNIETLINSIVKGMNFDAIRPSTQVQDEIESTTKKLEELAKTEEKISKLEKYLSNTGVREGKGIIDLGDSNEVAERTLDNIIKKMKEYVSLGGDLSKIQFKVFNMDTQTKELYSLVDVLEILEDEGKIDLIDDSQISNDVSTIKTLRKELEELNKELVDAQIRENRDLNVSLDTKSVEDFSLAITKAVEKVGELHFDIPEGFTLDGLSTENLDKIIVKLDEIVSTIGKIGDLLSTGIDTSKLQKGLDVKPIDNKDEIKSLSSVESKVDDITSAVDKKTEAFKKEESQVIESANEEIKALSGVEDKVEDITQTLNKEISLNIDTSVITNTLDVVNEKLVEISNKKINPIIDYSSIEPISDEKGETLKWYRGVKDVKSGFMSDKEDGTFWTTNRALAEKYADELGKVYEAELKMRNILEIDVGGESSELFEYLGNQSDETSIKITDLSKSIKSKTSELTKAEDELVNLNAKLESFKNMPGMDIMANTIQQQIQVTKSSIKSLVDEIDILQVAYDKISDDRNNPYGMVGTHDVSSWALKNGLDGVIFNNIKTTVDGITETIGSSSVIFSPEQLDNLKVVRDSIEDLHNADEPINIPISPDISHFREDIQEAILSEKPIEINISPNVDRSVIQDEIQQQIKEAAIDVEQTNEKIIASNKEVIASEEVKEKILNTDNLVSDTSSVDAEKAKIKELETAVSSVIEEIDRKTQAFHNEKAAVDMIIPAEIATLETLEGELITIRELIEQISKVPIDLSFDTTNLDENTQNVLKDITESLNNIDTSSLGNIGNILEGFKISKSNVDNLQKLANAILTLKSNLNNVGSQGQQFLSDIKELIAQADGLKDLATVLKATKSQIANAKQGTKTPTDEETAKAKELAKDYDRLIVKLEKFNTTLNNVETKPKKTSAYIDEINDIRSAINSINKLDPSVDIIDENEIKNLELSISNIEKRIKSLDDEKFSLVSDDEINNLLKQASKIYNKNTAAPKELRDGIKSVIIDLERMKNGLEEADRVTFNKVRSNLKEFETQIEKTGKTGVSMADKIKKKFGDVFAYFATYVSIQDFIQMFRQGFETIKEYDNALTEMNKVSEESIQTLKEFQKESFDLADDIGTTASQIQNSTADWMRLGESLEEAKQSAQDANILFNVSEFETIDEATDSLVSMSQAFKDLEKGEIIDVVNNLGNNFAISTDGLATALKDSASSLQTAQNDFYESAALVTAANTVVQDPAKVGAGLRTIALRLTGTEAAREELAALGEDVDDFVVTTTSKMDQQIKDLTKTQGNFGVSLLDMNGNYRSTYEVLLDIAKVWDKIAEEDLVTGENRQNALLEMMAGKNRSNILASVLQSPEVLEEAYAYALDSEGSAMRENEAYLESIEAHLAQLKNAWDSLWVNENNREVITFFLDLAKGILETVDNIGVLNTALLGIGAGIGIKKSLDGGGRAKCCPSSEYATGEFSSDVYELCIA